MSDKLKKAVLDVERSILDGLGYGLSKDNADSVYPDSYYNNYEYNLFEKMNEKHKNQYGEGSGGELTPKNEKNYTPAKMASIRSSSAMTFNMLGNDEIELKANNALEHTAGKYIINYEEKIPTITTGKTQKPANLDAFLVSEDGNELMFCEMKMLEWFENNKSELKEAYLKEGNYPHKELFPQFMKARETIQAAWDDNAFTHYDVWQMFKHTLATHNYLAEHIKGNIKKVTLVNVVFEPSAESLDSSVRDEYIKQQKSERAGFYTFRNALIGAGIIDEKSSIFDVKYLSAKEFINCFEIAKDKKKYLSRYTF